MNFEAIFQTFGDWVLRNGPAIVIILVLALIGLKAAGLAAGMMKRMLVKGRDDVEIEKRADTLSGVVRYVSVIAIFLIAGMMLLRLFGIDIAPLLATAGIVGLAVGFGAQQLVQDVISGFFILLEDQIRVGDVVNIAGQGGVVQRVTLRMVVLRAADGNVHYVRNGQITVVTNMTKDYSRYVFDIAVAYHENTDEVVKVIRKVDEDLRADPEFSGDILKPIDVQGVDKFAESAVIIKASITTKPIKQWRVGREFNRRLKMKFDEVGIEIPFRHITLCGSQSKSGRALPLHIEQTGDN